MPSSPFGEIKTINTGGNCRDIDVDITDNVLVAAANYNGYFVYKINYDIEMIISALDTIVHMGPDNLDADLGDNRIESIVLSKENDIAFILDKYENIWLYKYSDDDNTVQYDKRKILTTCETYGAAWLSVAIDDNLDSVGVYFLLNHHSAELQPYCISEANNNIVDEYGWTDCLNIQNYYATGDTSTSKENCEIHDGYIWEDAGCQVGGDYSQYSTSLVWKKLTDVKPGDTAFNGDPDCEYIINQGKIAEKIFFNDGILSMTYGELGVRNFKQSDNNMCVVENLVDGGIVYEQYGEDYMTEKSGVDSNGNKTCENDEGWKEYFGNGIWDSDEELTKDWNSNGKFDIISFDEYDDIDNDSTWSVGDTLIVDYNENNEYDGSPSDTFIDCSDTYLNHFDYCKSQACSEPFPICYTDRDYIDRIGYPGLGGVYSSKGGIIPQIYSDFDTPGEVEIVYSFNKTIFTGLSHSNGCIIAELNHDGSIMGGLHQFAGGYTIKGIHHDGSLLAMAAGNDGILLYNWNGGADVSFIGKIETAYANNVKVAGDIIFAATEDGIEVIQIDF